VLARQDRRVVKSIVPGNPGYVNNAVTPADRPLTCRRCYHVGTPERPGHRAINCSADSRRDAQRIIASYKDLPRFLKGKVFPELYWRAKGVLKSWNAKKGNQFKNTKAAGAPSRHAGNQKNKLAIPASVGAAILIFFE